MDNLRIFVPITKIDVAKRLVYGTMAEEVVDKSKEIFDYATSKPFFEKWSGEIAKNTDGKSVGNLRAMHQPIAAGKLTDIVFNDDARKIETCAHVVDAAEWEKVDKGVYTGFSIGGRYVKRWDDPGQDGVKRYTADPAEVSLVDNPCIATATFSAIKADGTTELRKFVTAAPTVEPPAGVVAERAMKLAAAGGSSKWPDFIEAARAELIAEGSVGKLKHGDVPGDDQARQVIVHPDLPGEMFDTKAAMRDALAKKAGTAAATAVAAPVVDALKGLTVELNKRDAKMTVAQLAIATTAIVRARDDAPLFEGAVKFFAVQPDHDLSKRVALLPPLTVGADGKPVISADLEKAIREFAADVAKVGTLGKREFSDEERKKYAKEGVAMKDGGYPIPDKAALKDAIDAFGRAKNKAATKRHIIKRAKALDATDELPEDWRGSTKGKKEKDTKKTILVAGAKGAVTKNMFFVQGIVGLLAQLEQWEEDYEYLTRWGAADPEREELCREFGTVLVNFADLVAAILDHAVNAITAEEEAEAGEKVEDVMERGATIIGLLKFAAATVLAKAGARHSKGDMELLNKAHDTLVELGAECKGGEEEDGETEKMAKLSAQVTTVSAERDALVKQFGDLVPLLKDISERVIRIEAQPAVIPPRALLSIGKNGEAVPLGGDNPMSGLDVDKFLDGLDDAKLKNLAQGLIKRAQQNPISGFGPNR